MATNPLIRVAGLQQLLDQEAVEPPKVENLDADWPTLAQTVRKTWQRNKLAKTKTDIKLLKQLRARRGYYSSAELANIEQQGGLNIVWADLTETKCRAASAWIREIVLPVGERAWGIDPTPISDLPKPMATAIVDKAATAAKAAMMQMYEGAGQVMDEQTFRDMAAEIADELHDEAHERIQSTANERAERMETTIADRMADGGWYDALDAFVEDFVTYPTAILKGPFYRNIQTLEWASDYTPKVATRPTQSWSRVSPFDVYPAPGAKDAQGGDFIERMRFWRKDLHALKGLPGYRDEQIDGALIDYSGGHLEGWLWTEAERNRLENESLYLWLSPPGMIDALNFWGSIPGWQLMSWGVTTMDGQPLEASCDYAANIIIIGKYIIYAALNPDPLGKRPYWHASYDAIPNSFWGRSIPDLCETHQKMCNAIACALADNLSMASGPMVWVYADRFADGENSVEIYPWKVWQLKSDPTQGANPGIGFFQADDRSGPLMNVYDKWELKADDASGVPRYTYGNENVGGAADTATGLAMLLNNAAKGLRRAISNIDLHVIQPTVEMAFVNEMLYNSDQSIKGDCRVVPRGAAAILIKESAQQRRTQFLAMTANPIDMQIIGLEGRAEVLRETCAAMELPVDKIVPSSAEMKKRKVEQEQAQAQAAQAQAQAAQQAQAANQEAEAQRIAAIEGAKTQREQGKSRADLVKTIVQASIKNQGGGGNAAQPGLGGENFQGAQTVPQGAQAAL